MTKNTINAKIVADSIDPRGNRITTFVLTYPRIIHAEMMTHRVFSRNAASSRAIPFKTMVKSVEGDPFIPIAWQKDHKGMQGTEYFTESEFINIEPEYAEDPNVTNVLAIPHLKSMWLHDKQAAISMAMALNKSKVTKQLCNRLLEPYQWYTCLVTTTELENFYKLRAPKLYHAADGNTYNSVKDWNKVDPEIQWNDIACLHPDNSSQAEIHIQALAEAMWDSQNESTPKQLKAGEWHIPFGDKIDYALHKWNFLPNITELWGKDMSEYGIKIATARAARLSYMTFDGEINYEKDIALHDQLLASGHYSPFEHCARAMSNEEYVSFIKGEIDTIETDNTNPGDFVAYNKVWNSDKEAGWCNNFKGFIQYRYLLEGGSHGL